MIKEFLSPSENGSHQFVGRRARKNSRTQPAFGKSGRPGADHTCTGTALDEIQVLDWEPLSSWVSRDPPELPGLISNSYLGLRAPLTSQRQVMNTQNNNIVAIDIAKETLQVQTENIARSISNDAKGFEQLAKLLAKLENPHVVCEATGGYERPLLRSLYEQEVVVSVVNPATVRSFAKGEGIRVKTDLADGRMLLKYGQTRELRPTLPPDPEREELAALMDRRSQLSDSLTREKNRLEKEPVYTRKLIEDSISFLELQIAQVDARIEGIAIANKTISGLVERMTQVKGVGRTTAFTVLAYLPDLDTLTRGQMVALAGLAPFNRESGKTKSKAFIHGGRAKVRKCLYMAAQSAARHNEVIRNYVRRLVEAGQPYKSALVAAMRKILVCLRSLVKNENFTLA